MANLLLDLDFDSPSQPVAPVQRQQSQSHQYDTKDPFQNFYDMQEALPNQSSSRVTRDKRYSDEDDDDYDRGRDRGGRSKNRYSDEEDSYRGTRRGSGGDGKMKLSLNISKPGEKRDTSRRAAPSSSRVQRSTAGGARASSPDRGGRNRYDDNDYGSSSRSNKYDDYDDDPEYGSSRSRDRYDSRRTSGSSSRNRYDDNDDDRGDRGGSSRRYDSGGGSSFSRKDSWGGRGGSDDYDRDDVYRCYRARAWESYENEITGMEYEVDKAPENRIVFTLERDGMRVERESDGREMFYDYRNIAKINHKHGSGDNFLNFLMKDDRMITISSPSTVEIKRRLLERVKHSAGLKLGNYRSSREQGGSDRW